MAGLINWKKVSIPGSNPDSDHCFVGIDSSDDMLYVKNSAGTVYKYQTSADVTTLINTALADYDLSTVVDSKIATAINDLVNGAGAALDTLNELATALGNDPNFATTIAAQQSTQDTNISSNATAASNAQTTADNHIADLANPHAVTQTQVGLGNVDNTSDLNKPISTATQAALDLKYDASNPDGYETPAELNARDTANRNRANHTGTQLASTISDFSSAVLSTVLTGLSLATSTPIVATDTLIVALGKLQAQIDLLVFGKEYEYTSSEGLSTTTSAAPVNKLTMSTAALTTGRRYRIEWYAEHINTTSAADLSFVQIVVDGTEVGLSGYETEDLKEWRPYSGFYEFTATNSTSIDIDVNFYEDDGGTANIRRVRLAKWRVV